MHRIVNEPILQLLPRPRSLAEESEAGFDRGIEHETTDRNALREHHPAIAIHLGSQHRFQRHAVQRIIRVGLHGSRLTRRFQKPSRLVRKNAFISRRAGRLRFGSGYAGLGFAPKIGPEDFRAPFTAAEGWGTFTQEETADGKWSAQISLAHGKLTLREIRLPWLTAKAVVKLGDAVIAAVAKDGVIRFSKPHVLVEGGAPLSIG